MERLSSLRSFIDSKKTLVITCHECFQQVNTQASIYIYQCLGNMLRKEDHLQQDCIRYYLDVKRCTQIILAGHYDCQVIQKILTESSLNTPLSVFQYNLEKLLKEHANCLLQPHVKDRMLVELNVMEQLKLLMEYDFIYKKVNDGGLNVMGVVLDHNTNATTEIFRNGLTFNTLVDSN